MENLLLIKCSCSPQHSEFHLFSTASKDSLVNVYLKYHPTHNELCWKVPSSLQH